MWQNIKLSEQIGPWDTLACCWDVKQPTNKQTLPINFICIMRYAICIMTVNAMHSIFVCNLVWYHSVFLLSYLTWIELIHSGCFSLRRPCCAKKGKTHMLGLPPPPPPPTPQCCPWTCPSVGLAGHIVLDLRVECSWSEGWMLLIWVLNVVDLRVECCWSEGWLLLIWGLNVVDRRVGCCWSECWMSLIWGLNVVDNNNNNVHFFVLDLF